MFTSHRRTVAITLGALLLLQTTGCTEWHPVTNPGPDQIQAKSTSQYRITTRNGTMFTWDRVHYRSDSILGFRPGATSSPEVGWPMSDIVIIERFSTNVANTILLMVGVSFAALTVAWVLAWQDIARTVAGS